MMIKIEVYSKPDCPLCDKAIGLLEKAKPEFQFELQITDITKNQDLFDRYCFDIPVVLINDKIEFMGIVEQQKLSNSLRALID